MDIYVDGEFKATVGTKSDTRQAQQTVYGLSGLSNGSHTFKAVKKSGNFMLLDQLIVEMPNLISPTAAEFDKADGKQADLSISLPDNDGRFAGIVNGSRTLTEGSDYTVSGSMVTISHVYLASLPAGAAQLTFQFSGDYESDIHYTANDGDSFTYSFRGTGAELFMPTSPELGTADYLCGWRAESNGRRSWRQPRCAAQRLLHSEPAGRQPYDQGCEKIRQPDDGRQACLHGGRASSWHS